MHVTYDMRIGGTEQVIKSLIENTHNDYKMSVLCIESPLGPFAAPLQAQGVEFHALTRQPGFDWHLIKHMRRVIQQNNVDILHCHQYTPWIYGVIAAFATPTKVIFTEHGRFYPDFGTWKRKLVNPILASFTHAITAISEATRDALCIHENISKDNIQVIYNGIYPLNDANDAEKEALKNKLGIPSEAIVLGTIARFDPIKNHLMMLRAFKDCLDAGFLATLVIVGDGEMRSQIEAEIATLGIQQDVILTGYDPEPRQYLAIMDIFLLSSFSEGTSMTLLEAMSLGKPCVVTDAGGNKEVISDKENGFVTPNDDQGSYANAIIELLQNPELLQRYGHKSKSLFAERFQVDKMAAAFSKIYSDI
jgi:glycosyltransferase involved in cell wall biosynthesis